MELKIDLSLAGIDQMETKQFRGKAQAAVSGLKSGTREFTGWVNLPLAHDQEELHRIEAAARRIQKTCDVLIVIGIGGSYLGARAAINALPVTKPGFPKVLFAGNNISGTYHAQIVDDVKGKDVCLCVISKSGTTTEPSIAFAILKDMLIQKYGHKEAARRIYAITDQSKGILREEVQREGYESFVVPDDIGGRYSVLTAVGLLPMAAAGIDIQEMLRGAREACLSPAWAENGAENAADYAINRYVLMERGKAIEVIEYYEPQLQYFAEWLKQLFGESEGKGGRGLFPASLSFSADLHSMGQFLQEGHQVFFETVLNIENPQGDILVPESAGALLAGRSMNQVNQAAVCGVIAAHAADGIPIIRIDIPELTPFYFGQMVYFFEMTSAITGTLMGVNPFDQPGVERYKAEMRNELVKQE